MSLFDPNLLQKPVQYELKRTFWPIGQGAFYSELFNICNEKQFSVVYDCGSETIQKGAQQPLLSQIQSFRNELIEKKIDLLFISHFHEDHINGLFDLLKGMQVNKTVIPMLTEDVITLMRIRNLINNDGIEASDQIICGLYGVDEASRPEEFGNIIGVLPGFGGHMAAGKLFPSNNYATIVSGGSSIPFATSDSSSSPDSPIWYYKIFNSLSGDDKRATSVVNRIKKIPGVINDKGKLDVSRIVQHNLKEVKAIYNEEIKNDNLYTLAVESYPSDNLKVDDNSRCLYTGDLELSIKAIREAFFNTYNNYRRINIIQVPHHGSKHNWNKTFLEGDKKQFIVSSGSTNRYHHPNYWVLKEIEDNKSVVDVVCEAESSKKDFYCHFHW